MWWLALCDATNRVLCSLARRVWHHQPSSRPISVRPCPSSINGNTPSIFVRTTSLGVMGLGSVRGNRIANCINARTLWWNSEKTHKRTVNKIPNDRHEIHQDKKDYRNNRDTFWCYARTKKTKENTIHIPPLTRFSYQKTVLDIFSNLTRTMIERRLPILIPKPNVYILSPVEVLRCFRVLVDMHTWAPWFPYFAINWLGYHVVVTKVGRYYCIH
jgi:hypothetical protein